MVFCLLLAVTLCLIIYLAWPYLLYFKLRKFMCKRGDLKKAGERAIVTGPSEGIGRAFAELLAKEGLNVFLLGLGNSGLEEIASDLENKYNVQTKIFIADLIKVC